MKSLIRIAIVASAITLPGCASAKAESESSQNNCGMMADRAAMQKDMNAMMSDMDAMMKKTMDPAMRDRMQKMHDQMATMSSRMGMGSMGMMGGKSMGMTRDKPAHGGEADDSANTDDHKGHHPTQ